MLSLNFFRFLQRSTKNVINFFTAQNGIAAMYQESRPDGIQIVC